MEVLINEYVGFLKVIYCNLCFESFLFIMKFLSWMYLEEM